MSGLADICLGWHEDALTASLSVTPPLTDDELIEKLVEVQCTRSSAPEFGWANDIRTDPENFIEGITAAQEDKRVLAFLSSFGCELALDGKQNLKPTAFHMTSGQQRFLKQARELSASLEPLKSARKRKAKIRLPSESFREALFGPSSAIKPLSRTGRPTQTRPSRVRTGWTSSAPPLMSKRRRSSCMGTYARDLMKRRSCAWVQPWPFVEPLLRLPLLSAMSFVFPTHACSIDVSDGARRAGQCRQVRPGTATCRSVGG
jgi:hypothetical protein